MPSYKSCVKQHCKNCTYDAAQPGTYLQQIENCTVTKCALWSVRPMTVATINLNRNTRPKADLDLDALIEGLEDDEDETVQETV